MIVSFGGITLHVKPMDLTITPRPVTQIIHFIDTSRSEFSDLGMMATEISGTFMVYSEAEKQEIERYIYTKELEVMRIGSRLYRRVLIGSASGNFVTTDGEISEIGITFIALDPMPRDSSGRGLY